MFKYESDPKENICYWSQLQGIQDLNGKHLNMQSDL